MDTLAIPTFLIVIFLLNELEMENVLIFKNFNISTFSYPNSQSRRVVKMGFLGTA